MSHGIDDSPARDALQEHLDAPLSIRKKRSWMHTLREAVQKGALTAKAAVDNFRGEPIVSTKKVQASEEKDEAPTKHATTNSRMPRTATMSLRRHISRHNTYNSIVSTPDRIGGARGPESISDPGGMESPQENCHRKRNSVTSSIAGSLRGLRRRTSRIVDAASPTQLPAQYPLPSSPVPIPVPVLERLSLHFEPADFMSSDLGTELRARDEHEKHLGSPGVPTRNKWSSAEAMRSLSNVAKAPTLGLLDVPRDSFDFGFFDRSPSPMPGTNLTLEIDGAHDQGLHLFERSVMAKASRPQLRPMRSLDAMAEACAVAHEMEDNAATPKVGSPAAGKTVFRLASTLQRHTSAYSE